MVLTKRVTGQALFTVFLFAVTAGLLGMTLSLGPLARLVPIRVVIPTSLILLIQLGKDLASPASPPAGIAADASRAGAVERQSPRGELGVFLWVLLLGVLVYLLGFTVSAPLYTFLCLKHRSAAGWLSATVLAIAACGLVYGLFALLLGARLYEGQIWSWLGS